MSKNRASQVHTAADRVLAHGRRILLRTGLNASSEWRAVDTATDSGSQNKPLRDYEVVVARTPPITLTPGHFLRGMFVYLPAGEVENYTPPIFSADGTQGIIRIEVTYDNGTDTETITKEISTEGSKLENGAQPTAPGAGWAAIRRYRTDIILPTDIKNVQNLAAWCDGVTAEITLTYIGNPRIIDLCVHEEPVQVAYDANTDGWIIPMHSDAGGGDLGNLSGGIPLTQFATADTAGGTRALLDAAVRLCQTIGPVVWYFSSWCESLQNVTDVEAAPVTCTSTNAAGVFLFGAGTNNNGLNRASSLFTSGCANAARVQESERDAVMRSAERVIPVQVWVYASMSTGAGPTGQLFFEGATDSGRTRITVNIPTGTTDAWQMTRGHMRTGLGAQNDMRVNIRARVSAASTLNVRYILVIFDHL